MSEDNNIANAMKDFGKPCDISTMTQEEINQKKLIAGLLAIFVGAFGIHKFYLGMMKEGIIMLVLAMFCGVSGFIGLAEGIIYLTKSNEEFAKTYLEGKKGWF